MQFEFTEDFAKNEDAKDVLKSFRNQFHFPVLNNKEAVYFCGNSLGLQPKRTKEYIQQELDDWAKYGVEGHFHAKNPWFSYHEFLTDQSASLVGALPREVVVMNQLTTNIHLLMVSFYRPTQQRFKIICEAAAFPSDQYALASQVKYHGFNPEETIIELSPRVGEYCIRTEDIINEIEKNKNELALIFIGGVNYLTGQVFDMNAITQAGHKAGAIVGFDLAHAAGNIKLELHNWGVDFACWCSYKYLNSGPGSVGGVFINEKHVVNRDLPRFAGWWGHNKQKRFLMEKNFVPIETAEGWQLSNAPVLSMAAHRASLDIFAEAGIDKLIEKSKKLTAYLEFIIEETNKHKSAESKLNIITPTDRGCQLSLIVNKNGKELHSCLLKNNIICDWREPNVIRLAPAPLYNSYEDVYRFGEIVKSQALVSLTDA